jgi:peptidoglycan/LPS O-acetylase OafA/YrhL
VFQLMASVSYLPLLLLGQSIYFASRKAWRTWTAMACIDWLAFIWCTRAMRPDFLSPTNSYATSGAFAVAIFLLAMSTSTKMRLPRPIVDVSTVSYSLYLTHGVTGFLLLDLLNGQLPLTASIAISLLGSYVVAVVLYRLVEFPSQRVARRFVSTLRLQSGSRFKPAPTATEFAGHATAPSAPTG